MFETKEYPLKVSNLRINAYLEKFNKNLFFCDINHSFQNILNRIIKKWLIVGINFS